MVPNSKVFVGGLPSGSKPQELRRLFENYGVVTECDIMNRCGFVHMETPQMAETAIRALHNTTFKASVITVEPGRPKDRNGGGGGGPMNRGGPGGPPPNPRMGGNMGAGPPRGNVGPSGPDGPRRVGGPPGGPDRQPGGREGNAFNAGPMRRDRSAPRRDNEPYTRNNRNFGGNGGNNNLQDNFQGSSSGGYRNYDSNSAPKNFSSNRSSNFGGGGGGGSSAAASNYGGNSGGPGGHFSVGNQDKRGFVLPNQQFESNRNPGIGVNQASRGGFGNKVNPFSRPMPMNPAGAGSASAGGFVKNPFSKPMGGGNMNSQPERNFSGPGRGGRGGRGGIQSSGRGGMQGGGRGGFPPNQNYNEAFPPLGASRDHPGRGAMMGNRGFGGRGGGFNRGRGGGGPHMDGGMGNPGFNRGGGGGFRNGPPHRDNMMMNRR